MKKYIFTLQIHSMVGLITNSSSELFVGKYNSKKTIINLVKSIYPHYLDEYYEIKTIDELSIYDLEIYIDYRYCYDESYYDYEKGVVIDVEPELIPGFTKDDMYKEPSYGYVDIRRKFVRYNYKEIIKALDPDRKMFFLFSKCDNPNWDMQKKLMQIMNRYHLG